ncbi:TRAP-type C4-dicarboxylate transport system, small permease component [Desulfotomaculum arcticum]|uniref:TRAP-type C4-dicarboxylate transport system, small permease component n=1 Tax=Desulfotruncus arcticus DSM 17038 TaxID=1121424 RepID=A0A1I2P8S2_9FIRM|nr:TRAP-type C4-dicarboxylate transport system, small permease component [Desulfotomaculum arcticum] [Desulfotruncus arcticus DSM 17038]
MVRKVWNSLEEYILVFSLAFTVFLIFIQIVMRYVFHHSLSWSEELARYVFLWQIWLGASFAVKEHRHLRIEAIKNVLSPKAQKYFELITLVIWFGFSLFLAFKGAELTMILLQRGQVSPAMRLPMAYAYASVPVGCGLMAIRLIEEMFGLFRKGEA